VNLSRVPAKTRFIALAALAALSGCSCDSVPAGAVTACNAEVGVGAVATDVLFVVDDSGSMGEEQTNLHDNLGRFIDALAGAPVRNDFQIAVTNTSVSDWIPATTWYTDPASPNVCNPATTAGCPRIPADVCAGGCPMVPFPDGTAVAVARGAGGAPVNGELAWTAAGGFGGARILSAASPTLIPDFQANVQVGTWGSGKEQPLLAARHALEKAVPGGPNEGLLRPGARLAIVILTDEDDCSDSAHVIPTTSGAGNPACHDPTVKQNDLDPVSGFASFMDGPIAGESRRPVVAVIAGYNQTSLQPTGCATSFDNPTRLDALLGALDAAAPGRTLRASICDTNFGPTLETIADALVPQTVPLDGAPQDPRLLSVTVTRAGGSTVACPVALEGAADAGTAGALLKPTQAGQPATLTFQGMCTLRHSDRIDVRIVCAG
jgi:hypothetical protein